MPVLHNFKKLILTFCSWFTAGCVVTAFPFPSPQWHSLMPLAPLPEQFDIDLDKKEINQTAELCANLQLYCFLLAALWLNPSPQ